MYIIGEQSKYMLRGLVVLPPLIIQHDINCKHEYLFEIVHNYLWHGI